MVCKTTFTSRVPGSHAAATGLGGTVALRPDGGAAVCAEHQPQRVGMASRVEISSPRLNSHPAATGLGGTVALRSARARQGGYTLAEFLVATGLGGLLLTVVAYLIVFGARSFVATANYLDLDQHSQQSLDQMSREIRQADHLTSFSTNDLTFVDGNGNSVEYKYDSNGKALDRIIGGVTNTLLTGCDSLIFSIYQRNPMSNQFEPYSTSTYTNAKMIEINWNCSRTIMTAKANTESIQSAKIEIRNH